MALTITTANGVQHIPPVAGGGPALSNATPQPPGTAAAGSTGEASDAGHVHARELPDPTALPDGHVATVASGAWTAAAPAGGGAVRLYASDGTAVPASEGASISGVGVASEWTLTASAAARAYGSGGVTAASIAIPLPTGARRVVVENLVTAASGMSTGGYRFLSIALRNRASGNPTFLWGASWSDGGLGYGGNMLGGANAGVLLSTMSGAPTAADRWQRLSIDLDSLFLTAAGANGPGAGARPARWVAPLNAAPLAAGSIQVGDPEADNDIVIILQGFTTGGATSVSGKATVLVWS